jgi:3-methyladenine DNA glycosylase Mpg
MELLGNKLVRIISNAGEKPKGLSGIIVETEAYGFKDAAGHALTPQVKPERMHFVCLWNRVNLNLVYAHG